MASQAEKTDKETRKKQLNRFVHCFACIHNSCNPASAIKSIYKSYCLTSRNA